MSDARRLAEQARAISAIVRHLGAVASQSYFLWRFAWCVVVISKIVSFVRRRFARPGTKNDSPARMLGDVADTKVSAISERVRAAIPVEKILTDSQASICGWRRAPRAVRRQSIRRFQPIPTRFVTAGRCSHRATARDIRGGFGAREFSRRFAPQAPIYPSAEGRAALA